MKAITPSDQLGFVVGNGKNILSSEVLATIRDSQLFDEVFYLDVYPDVAAVRLDPLTHYIAHGAYEGRNPHPLFNTDYYLAQCPEINQTYVNPLWHYLNIGVSLGFDPNPYFDTSYYLEKYPDVARSGVNPLKHYIICGAREGRYPSPEFDTKFYARRYAELIQPGTNPLAHFLQQGRLSGNLPKPETEKAIFARLHDDYWALRKIEPLLPPTGKLEVLVKRQHPSYSPLADAYFKLIDKVRDPFSHLYLLPHIGYAKVSRNSLRFCKLLKQNDVMPPLILVTDQSAPKLNQYFRPEAQLIYLPSLVPGLSIEDKVTIIVRLIVQTSPVMVHNFDSLPGWLSFREYHKQLNHYSQLAASLPTEETDKDGIPCSNTTKFFNQCIDHVKWIFVDEEYQKSKLIETMALENDNSQKIIVANQPSHILEEEHEGICDDGWQEFTKIVSNLKGYLK